MIMRVAAIVAVLGSFSGALAQGAAPKRPWTLLVYGAADNNADEPILEFLDGVRRAVDRGRRRQDQHARHPAVLESIRSC